MNADCATNVITQQHARRASTYHKVKPTAKVRRSKHAKIFLASSQSCQKLLPPASIGYLGGGGGGRLGDCTVSKSQGKAN